MTDANVVLGITNAEGLLGGRLEGDPELARDALAGLGARLGISAGEAALGVYRIVNATMAQAIRTLTVQRGIDPRDFALVSFGGAGGQHAVEVAREMQIPRVVFPLHPSTFSALGLLTADVQTTRTHPAIAPLEETGEADVGPLFADLERRTAAALGDAGDGRDVVFRRFADLRYAGQVHSIRTATPVWDRERIGTDFEDLHETRYGTRLGDPLQVVNVGVTARLELAKPRFEGSPVQGGEPTVLREATVALDEARVPVIDRRSLGAGARLPAPCLVEETDSVLYLPGGTRAVTDELLNVVCEVNG